MNSVKIKYVGHACFALEYKGSTIVIDPYKDGMVPGLSDMREKADFVYCSHGHDDHSYLPAVELSGEEKANFGLEEIILPHDDADGSKRGMNTVHIFDFGGLRVAHMGDVGRTLTEEEAEKLKNLDCLMLPVGGFYTVGSEEAAAIVRQLSPKVAIPMHYSGVGFGFENIASVVDFAEAIGEENVRYCGSEYELSEESENHVRAMRPAMLNISAGDAGKEFHAQGYNCCQCVLRACSHANGLGLEDANLGYGFGGGMYIKSVCGALTGALMSIGAACMDGEKPNACRPDAKALSLEMEERFKERFGTLMCGDIVEKYEKTLCDTCIAEAAEMALEIIEKYKNK